MMENEHLWSVVTAAQEDQGAGLFWLHGSLQGKPKQHCPFIDGRSLFQHTLNRADRLAPPERRVTVVSRAHRALALEQLRGRPADNLIFQPRDCGSAPGIFLPLTYVYAWDPEATVVISPPDHFVHPQETFTDAILQAAGAIERLPRRIILMGAAPDGRNSVYGLLQTGQCFRSVSGRLRTVKRILSNPLPAEADKAVDSGALRNTSIVVAKVKMLWNLGFYCIPEVTALFAWLAQVIGTYREGEVLESIYQSMPSRSFSTHLLNRIRRHLAVMELKDVVWSDLGRPEQVAEVLSRVGKQLVPQVPSLRAS